MKILGARHERADEHRKGQAEDGADHVLYLPGGRGVNTETDRWPCRRYLEIQAYPHPQPQPRQEPANSLSRNCGSFFLIHLFPALSR